MLCHHAVTTPPNYGTMTTFDGDRAAAAMAAARAAGESVVFQSFAHCSKPPAPGSKLRNCEGLPHGLLLQCRVSARQLADAQAGVRGARQVTRGLPSRARRQMTGQ